MHALAIVYVVLTLLFLLTKGAGQEDASALFSLASWCVAVALAIVVIAS